MFRIAVLCSPREMKHYDWNSINNVIENRFINNKCYKMDIWQQEKDFKDCFDRMKTGGYHAVIFATNVSNDERLREIILDKKEVVGEFIKHGGGYLYVIKTCLRKRIASLIYCLQVCLTMRKKMGKCNFRFHRNINRKIWRAG